MLRNLLCFRRQPKPAFDISVVVPIYNVEDFLPACLNSIAAQTKQNMQVILIDDGSTDGSGPIAQQFADAHEHWEYHRLENGGLSAARNRGACLATGTYLAFVDSDDALDPSMYQKMFDAAQRDGSDMVICNALRTSSKGVSPSAVQRRAFINLPPCTHITRSTSLVYDSCAWNKLIRRDFYQQSGIQWPEGYVYEDFPVCSTMHFLANHVSVINEPLYFWRIRENGQESITQKKGDEKNLHDRIAMCAMAQNFFAEHAPGTEALNVIREKIVETEMPIVLRHCMSFPDEQLLYWMEQIRLLIQPYATTELLATISPVAAKQIACALEGDADALRQLDPEAINYAKASSEQDDQGFRLLLPEHLYGMQRYSATTPYRLSKAVRRLVNVAISSSAIELLGVSYYRRISIPFGEQAFSASLINEVNGLSFPLRCTRRRTKALTERRGTTVDPYTGENVRYDYEGAGFKVRLDAKKLLATIPDGEYLIRIDVQNAAETGFFLLGNSSPKARGKIQEACLSAQGRRLRLELSMGDIVRVVAERES